MNGVFAAVLAIHGIAHLVGFLVAFRWVHFEEIPYSTTLFDNRIDVGDTGIRIIGMLWLMTALGCFGLATASWFSWDLFVPVTLGLAFFSLALCLAGWPDTVIGTVINGLLIVILILASALGWVV